jgi:hypothetical protein
MLQIIYSGSTKSSGEVGAESIGDMRVFSFFLGGSTEVEITVSLAETKFDSFLCNTNFEAIEAVMVVILRYPVSYRSYTPGDTRTL